MEGVEDAYSGIPRKDPPPPPNTPDGRMYPPLADNITRNPNGGITARTRHHIIEVGPDGSIRIRHTQTGRIEFEQAGAGR